MNKTNFLIFIFFLLISCSGLKDAGKVLRNEKVTTTDEFLIKKRNPLVLPPDYEKIPVPGSSTKNSQEEENKIKKILKAPPTDKSTKSKSSIEDSILKNIRK